MTRRDILGIPFALPLAGEINHQFPSPVPVAGWGTFHGLIERSEDEYDFHGYSVKWSGWYQWQHQHHVGLRNWPPSNPIISNLPLRGRWSAVWSKRAGCCAFEAHYDGPVNRLHVSNCESCDGRTDNTSRYFRKISGELANLKVYCNTPSTQLSEAKRRTLWRILSVLDSRVYPE